MSFSSLVERLILKKTSLLLSVTLMLRCSELAGSPAGPPAGLPFSFSADMLLACCICEHVRMSSSRKSAAAEPGREMV